MVRIWVVAVYLLGIPFAGLPLSIIGAVTLVAAGQLFRRRLE